MLIEYGCCSPSVPKPEGWRDQLRSGGSLPPQHAARILDFFFDLQARHIQGSIPYCERIANRHLRLLSDTGRSFAFDDRGTGFGRGEGCGMLVLKPLDQAIKDNDTIRAVIAGTGLNQDGKTPGITMPNGSAQGRLRSPFWIESWTGSLT